jgi:hypothetical protein
MTLKFALLISKVLFYFLQKKVFILFFVSCPSFYLLYLFQFHAFTITFIQYILSSPFAEASLHLYSLLKLLLRGINLPGVRSRETNSGLPYSRPAHYQLSYAAHLTELRCTLPSYAAPKNTFLARHQSQKMGTLGLKKGTEQLRKLNL